MATIEELTSLVTRAPFKVGLKQLYMPAFSVSLLRTRHLGPKYAKFSVPLWFSKVDLRDYLFHAYNVRILGVRSYVKLRPIVRGVPSGLDEEYAAPQYGRLHRPKSLKFMTVELESPFVWPEVPQDLSPWQQELHLGATKMQRQQEQLRSSLKDAAIDVEHRNAMKEQYEAIMKGKKEWASPSKRSLGPVLGG